jgi:site-specific DNA-methyltransferase (adenine-specific)
MSGHIAEPIRHLAVPIDTLKPHGKNPRRGDLDLISESLKINGQYRPVVANRRTGEILAGNHTWKTAKRDGWTEIAVTWVDVDDEAARRIVAVDNRSNDLAEYDDRLLAELLAEVEDLAGTGYNQDDVDEITRRVLDDEGTPGPGNTDPDDIPELPAEPRSAPGDLWLLGPHRLVCGDSTDVGALETLLAGARADCVWTDPPYGVEIVGGSHALSREERLAKGGKTIQNDDLTADGLQDFLRRAFGAAFTVTKGGACWYVAAPPGPLHAEFAIVLKELNIWRQTLVWVKDQFVLGHNDYHYRHEPIFYGWSPGAAHHPPPGPQTGHGLGGPPTETIQRPPDDEARRADRSRAGKLHRSARARPRPVRRLRVHVDCRAPDRPRRRPLRAGPSLRRRHLPALPGAHRNGADPRPHRRACRLHRRPGQVMRHARTCGR